MRFIWIVTLLLTLSSAKMLDAIALVVNGEPITTRQIDTVRRQFHLDKKAAIDLLIQDRLQKAAMKEITVTPEQVDREIAKIAKRNRMSLTQLRQTVRSQGISWTRYRKSIEEALKKRALIRQKVDPTITPPSEEELKRYYEAHKEMFVIPKTVQVIEYRASNEKRLKALIEGKRPKGITSQRKTFQSVDLNSELLGKLLASQGSFTEPLNTGNGFVTYKVTGMSGQTTMPFESARNAVFAAWMKEHEAQALKNYLKKLKTEADIRYIRK